MSEHEFIWLHRDIFTSPRAKELRNYSNGNDFSLIWLSLLLRAGEIDDGGAVYITKDTPYDARSLGRELEFPARIVERALEVLRSLGSITIDENGIIYVTDWDKISVTDPYQ